MSETVQSPIDSTHRAGRRPMIAVAAMLDAHCPLVVVIDDNGQPQGTLHWDALLGDLPTKTPLR